jgi:SAM-dependent methyltransferase
VYVWGRPLFFGYENLAHAFAIYERQLQTLRMLKKAGYHPLDGLRILDVGCGEGELLRELLQRGAKPERLAGIELRHEAVEKVLSLNPNLEVRWGTAEILPWPGASFDLVFQHTVFTSVLNRLTRQRIAAEMSRVLKPAGAIVWYDFFYNNPWNPDVRGVTKTEIASLFPGFRLRLRRITLAPFIARRLPEPLLPVLYPLLAALRPLRTHYLGLLTRPRAGE